MKRTSLNLLIDALAAHSFLGMIATGYIIHFPLPPGTNKSLSLWGLTRHQWGGVHSWISLGLLAVLLTHLALHWQWVVTVVARQFHFASNPQSRPMRSGAIAFLTAACALSLFAWAASNSVSDRDSSQCLPGETTGELLPIPPETVETDVDGAVAKAGFWVDVYPVLESSCLSCHGPSMARADFRVDRPADYFGENGRPPLVILGRSEESPLIAIVTGAKQDMAMANRHRLPAKEVSVLAKWIDAGAHWPQHPSAGDLK